MWRKKNNRSDYMRKKYYVLIESIIILVILLAGCASVDSLIEKGELEKAIELAKKQKGEKQKEGYLKIAGVYFKKDDYDKAVEYYLKAGENEKAVYSKVADAYFDKGDYDKAVKYYFKANKKRRKIYLKIAEVCFEKEEYKKAAEYYEKALETDKANECYLNLADQYFSKGDYDKAVENYLKVADAAFSKGKYEVASYYYEKANGKEGDTEKDIYKKVADAAFSKGKYEVASYYYEKANGKEGDTEKDIYKKVADAAFNKKEYIKAIYYYKQVGYKDKDIYTKVADAYSNDKFYDEAANYYYIADKNNALEKIKNMLTIKTNCKKLNIDRRNKKVSYNEYGQPIWIQNNNGETLFFLSWDGRILKNLEVFYYFNTPKEDLSKLNFNVLLYHEKKTSIKTIKNYVEPNTEYEIKVTIDFGSGYVHGGFIKIELLSPIVDSIIFETTSPNAHIRNIILLKK